MKNCKHPSMEGECFNGKQICCRYCDQIKECINNCKKQGNASVCPHFDDENDLSVECPFEGVDINVRNFI
jgi:hypothetical protein